MSAMNNNPSTPKSTVTKRGLMQAVLIAVLLVILLCVLNSVFMSKAGHDYILAGQENPESSYDVIFAGSSHMNNAVYPMVLWEKYGFTSFNNAQSGEVIPVSYYTCKAAVETYHPKVLVLDVYMLYYTQKSGNISWMHQSLDALPARYRLPAIFDLVPQKNLEEFLFPFTLYHSRWKELGKEDFTGEDSLRRGSAQNFTRAQDIVGLTFEYTQPEEKIQPTDIPLEYLDKIVEMCKQTDTQLLLVALPYFISEDVEKPTHDMSNDQAYFNWMADYAAEKGVPYINYFHMVDELGFEWTECLYNYSHMNYWGGSIITEHLGAYLTEHYALPDRRDDPAYAHWNHDLEVYNRQVEEQLNGIE